MTTKLLPFVFLSLFLALPAAAAEDCNDDGKVYKICANQEDAYAAALAKAKAEKKKLLVVIGAEWCPWCLSLHKMLGDQKVSADLAKKYLLVDIALYRAKEKIPTGLAVRDKLKEQAGYAGELKGIPILAMVNPANGKTTLIDTEPLEKNTKTSKGHDAKKVMAALKKAAASVQ